MYTFLVVTIFIFTGISLAMPGNNVRALLDPRDAVAFWGGKSNNHDHGIKC